jgi:hypothetical protein
MIDASIDLYCTVFVCDFLVVQFIYICACLEEGHVSIRDSWMGIRLIDSKK